MPEIQHRDAGNPQRSAMTRTVVVRVYGPLNDFLPRERRHAPWRRTVDGHPSVKDVIEGVGVPHPEIDLVLVDGASAAFDYLVQDGDRIAAYPAFFAVDIGAITLVRPQPPDPVRFVADVHLGTLARHLRVAGLDTLYRADADDAMLAEVSRRERRILLTRDRGLLKRRAVTYGMFLRETLPQRQFVEVLRRLGPLPLRPFSRCMRCNGVLRVVPKAAVDSALRPQTRRHYDAFDQCSDCGHVYWKGSHWSRLSRAIDAARVEAEGPPARDSADSRQ